MQAIVGAMGDDLQGLLVAGDSWQERRELALLAEILTNSEELDSAPSFGEQAAMQLRAQKAYAALKQAHPQKVANLRQELVGYAASLEKGGVSDANVAGRQSPPPAAWLRGFCLLAVLPLALFGVVTYAIPYQLPRISYLITDEKDVISTYKLGLGLLVFPLWFGLLVALGAWLLPTPIAIVWASASLLAPFAALQWLDRIEDGGSTLNGLFGLAKVSEEHTKKRSAIVQLAQELASLAPSPEST